MVYVSACNKTEIRSFSGSTAQLIKEYDTFVECMRKFTNIEVLFVSTCNRTEMEIIVCSTASADCKMNEISMTNIEMLFVKMREENEF